MSNAVATVAFLQGKAWAKSPDGELRPLTVGSVLNANDILVTGLNARIELDTGELQRLVVRGGQEVAMNRDLNAETATGSEEAMLTDASVQEALTILEQGGDLLEELEETAAGNTGGAGGSSHGFVQLTRLIEQVDPLAFDFDAANAGSASVPATDTDFPRNNPPEVVDQQLTFDEDTVLTGQIIATDIENDTLTYAVSTPPVSGVLILDSVTGSFTFTPNSNFNGLDSFVVSVTDTAGNNVNNIISLTINPVNDAPVSSAQPLVTNEDTPVTGQIVATDVENDVLSFAVSTNPANGVVTINAATGVYEYTPNTNFYGADSFVVTVSDGNGGVSSSTVNVTINSVNDAPVATNQSLTTAEDTPINGQIVASDVDADPLTYTVTTNPINGSLLFNANGSFTYTPNANYNGNDSFVVTVSDGQGGVTTSNISIGITPVNDAPVTSNQTITTNEDTAYVGQIVAIDVDANALTYSINTTPINGTLTLNQATGQYTYTPNANYNGSDSFSVLVNDNNGGIVTSVVTVGVTAVNDVPVAQAASFTVAEDAAIVNGSVTATDTDANATLTYALNNAAPAGLVFNTNGSYSFDASNTAYQSLGVGQQVVLSVPYTVTDDQNATSTANLVITVTGTNDAPVAQAASFTFAEDAAIINGSVVATDVDANAVLTYSLNNAAPAGLIFNSNGSYSFDASNAAYQSLSVGQQVVLTVPYTVTDDQNAMSTENLVITVTGTNDAPIAQAASFTVAEDAAVITGNVVATDVDANATLTYALNNAVPAGLTFNTNGSYSFDASNAAYQSLGVGQSVVLTIPYTVTDDQNATSTANLVITVTGTNDAPIAQASAFTVAEDAAIVNGSVTATDTDANATLTYALNNSAPAGLTFNTNGSYSFDASSAAYQSLGVGQSVVLTIPYTVTDDQSVTSTANLVITVTGTNDAPVAQVASFTVAEDAAVVTGNVAATDVDANATLTYSLNNAAPAGLTFNANGSYSFDASNSAYQSLGVGQSVVLTVPYIVTDDLNATSTENLVITVTGTNDAPVAQAASFTVAEDAAVINGSVVATDVDANAVLTYSLNNTAPAGLIFNPSGSYSFDASNVAYQSLGVGQQVVLIVPYTVTDDQNATSTANLVITVTGTNDGPVANTDVSSTPINTAVVIDVRANDSDVDNAQTDLVVSNPQVDATQGTVALDAQGRVVFTPALNFSGVANITYTLTDPAGLAAQGNVTVNVGANTAPTGTDNTITINEDGSHTFAATDFGFADADIAQTFNAVRIDSLPSAGSLTLGGVAVTAGQIISVASLGSLVFTPAADANGNNYANFTFSVQDSASGFDLSPNTIQLNITALNDAPVAQAASFIVAEDAAVVTGNLIATDIDAGAILTYTLNVAAPAGFTFNPDGSYSFDATNVAYQSLGVGQSVVLTIPYTVTDDQNATSTANLVITVTGTNDAPVAQAASFTVAEDATVINGSVVATDVDANAVLTFALNNTAPAGLIFNSNGSYSFDPSNAAYQSLGVGQSVVLTIPYTVTDDQNATSTANLVITVTGTNDTPVAQAASFTVAEDATVINGSVVATDVDANAVLTFALNNTAPAGLIFNSNGSYSFDPSNAAYQSLGVGQQVVLTIPYTVTDDQNATSTENLVITVTGTNDGPVANTDVSSTPINTAVVIDVRANDSDMDNLQTDLVVNNPQVDIAQGSATIDAQGRVVFTPALNFSGVATISYTLTDPAGAQATGTVTVNVSANTAPTGTDNVIILNEDGSHTFAANDFGFADVDVVQSFNAVRIDSLPAAGSLTLSGVAVTTGQIIPVAPLGALVFTPTADANGNNYANFTFSVQDSAGGFDLVPNTIQLNVTPINDAPVAQATNFTVAEDAAIINGSVIATDVDANATLTYALNNSAPAGLTFNTNGSYSFDASNAAYQSLGVGQSTVLTVPYTVTDDQNATSTANLIITVTGTNDSPVAQAASFTVAEDAAIINGSVVATDIDANAVLTFTLNNVAPAGLTFNSNGSYSFDASSTAYQSLGIGQSVVLTIPYTVTDDQNATSTANLIITVTGTNDAPIAQASAFTVAEDAAIVNGSVTANDTDANATLTYALNNAAPAGLTFNTNGSYSFDASNAAYQSLGVGQQVVLTIPYTVTDDQNETSIANLVITVTGTNDAPVAQAASFTVAEDASIVNGSVVATDVDANAVITYSLNNAAPAGLTFNTNGSYSFDASNAAYQSLGVGQSTVITIPYTVTDDQNATSTENLVITVTGTNDAPVAQAASFSVAEDAAVITGNVVATDVDANVTLTYSLNNAAPAGLTFNANGSYSFDASNAAYQSLGVGQQVILTVPYTVTDDQNATSTANLVITVTGTNDAPVAQAASFTVAEDAAVINGSVVATDIDANSVLTYSLNSSAPVGLVFNANGSYSFDASNAAYQSLGVGQSIVLTIPYTVTDDQNATSTANLVITVTGTNDAPAAQAASFTVAEDSAVINGSVVATDIDANSVLTYSLNSSAPVGLVFNANGSYSFDASNAAYQSLGVGQSVVLTVPYTVTDDQNATSTANLIITVTGTNDSPVAQAASFTVAEDAAVINGSVVATDVDANAVLTFTLNNAAPAGLTFNSNGSYSFDASSTAYQSLGVGQSVVLTIPYTVTDDQNATSTENLVITVTGTNDAPIAQAQSFVGIEDNNVAVNLSGSDVDGSIQSIQLVSLPTVAQGVLYLADGVTAVTTAMNLTVTQAANLIFTPVANFNGNVSFNFTVTDNNNGVSTPATIDIAIAAVNDAPVNTVPAAITMNEDTTQAITGLSISDLDAATGNLTVTLQITNGVLNVSGGSAVITNNGTNSVTLSGTQADINSTLAATVNYVTAANFNGTSTLTITTNDNGNSGAGGALIDVDTVSITVDNVWDLSVPNYSASGNEDTVISGNVTQDSNTSSGGVLTYQLIAGAANGVVNFNSDGTYTYTPNPNFHGSDVFTFKAFDLAANEETMSPRTVSITVNPVWDLSAPNFNESTNEGTVLNDNVHKYAETTSGGVLNYQVETLPAHGVLLFNSDGTYSYTPAANFAGLDSFTFRIFDPAAGETFTRPVNITVNPVDDSVVPNQIVATNEDTVLNGNLPTTDADGAVTYAVITNQATTHGTVSVAANGSYIYTPAANYSGNDSFVVNVTDSQNFTTPVTVSIVVNPVNDGSVANQIVSTNEDTVLNGNLPTTDADGAVTYAVITNQATAHGTVSVAANGSYIYTPNANYFGSDSFTVSVTDSQGFVTSVIVDITVNSVNDSPVNALPAGWTTDEDTSVALTGLSVSDTDSLAGNITLTLSVTSGLLSATSAAGVTVTDSGTSSLQLVGSQSALNAFLAASSAPVYQPAANVNGNINLTMTTNDGTQSDVDVSVIQIAPLNDNPVLQNESVSTSEDAAVTGNLLANDVDVDSTLTISNFTWNGTTYAAGTLASSSVGNLIVNSDGSYTFTPASNYTGAVPSVSYLVQQDGVNFGSANMSLSILTVNDAPVNQMKSFATDQGSNIRLSGMSVTDVDAGSSNISVTLSVSAGTLRANNSGGVTVSGSDTSSIVLTGTVSNLNAYLASTSVSPQYRPGSSLLGTVVLTMVTNDAGNTGSGGPLTDSDSSTITIRETSTGGNADPDIATPSPTEETTTAVTGNVLTNDQGSGNVTAFSYGSTSGSFGVALSGAYGSLVLNANGNYSYTVNTSSVQYLAVGESVSETFVYSRAGDQSTLTITITGENDAPVISAGTKSVTGSEDSAYIFNWSQFGISDVDASNSLQIRVPTLGFPTDGQLQFFNGTSWVALPTDPNSQQLTKANIDAGFFRFVPDANESGSDAFGGTGTGNMQSNYASFTYQGFDGTAVSNTATMVIDITPVVDDANVILGGVTIVDGSIVVPVTPASEGLTVRVYSNLANVNPTGVDTAAEVSGLLELLNAATPTSTSFSNAPQNYTTGTGSPYGITTDGAYRVTGLIYLEAGKTYTFSSYMDDSSVLRVGGTELLNQPYNNWGIKTANNFVPTANGYYSLDWVVYNGDGVGAFKPWLSVNGGTALELTAANYKLYGSVAGLESAGGIHDTFVANGAGGVYPMTNSGVEDSDIELAPIVVGLADTDGSEILVSIIAKGLLAGTVLTDGTNSFTATLSSTSVNLFLPGSGWNLSTLQLHPPVNFSGNYTLNLEVVTRETATGVESSSTRSIVIEVAAVNDVPVAAADSASVIEDTLSIVTGNLTANDQDVDGDTLSIQSVNGLATNVGSIVAGAYGQLVVQANGGYTYTLDTTNAQVNALNTSETLRDIFTYRVTDPSGETSLTSLVINIQGNTDSVTLSGTVANDNLSGTSANDVIEALAGNDYVDAGAGNDVIRLGSADSTGKTFADIRNDQLMTQAEGSVSVTTANGTNVGLGGAGNDAIIGGDGYDLAYGGADNDYLYGGASADGLRGGAGADRIQGGSGSDVMRGDAGADVFVWTLGDQASTPGSLDAGAANPFGVNTNIKVTENATDMIMDFSKSEGDVLDLRDLLQGESHLGTDPDNLTKYLHFETTNVDGVQGTIVHVSAHGDFASVYDATKEDMTIILQNVNLTIDSNGATLLDDRAIIQDLLTNNRLITD